uniref:Uncharacterized protein n=1 Tax=Arundo donax TaxID=35708 RepID=A0A0A8YRD8_ARUDO
MLVFDLLTLIGVKLCATKGTMQLCLDDEH